MSEKPKLKIKITNKPTGNFSPTEKTKSKIIIPKSFLKKEISPEKTFKIPIKIKKLSPIYERKITINSPKSYKNSSTITYNSTPKKNNLLILEKLKKIEKKIDNYIDFSNRKLKKLGNLLLEI